MNQSIEARMQYIEDELKVIREELEESLGRYYTSYKTSFLKPVKKTTKERHR